MMKDCKNLDNQILKMMRLMDDNDSFVELTYEKSPSSINLQAQFISTYTDTVVWKEELVEDEAFIDLQLAPVLEFHDYEEWNMKH